MSMGSPMQGMKPGTGLVRQGADLDNGRALPHGLVARVWREFARPYRSRLFLLIVVITGSSGLVVVPPLIFGRIVDVLSRQPEGARRLVVLFAAAAVGVALLAAALSFLQRWLSAWIGEQLIFDLRVRLYDHIQRMPLAFFTRTQTGALISRLNNDVVGAQRALTGTFGTLTSNTVQVVATLVAMFALHVGLTLVVLSVLPIFVFMAKRVGRRLQHLTRESMTLDADMSTRMTERFNVAGAQLVKLFGHPEAETAAFADRARGVAEVGVRSAVAGRLFFVILSLVGAIGTAVVYLLGGVFALSGGVSVGDVVAFAGLVTAAYTPLAALTNAPVEVMTALVSFDRVFEVLDVDRPIDDRDGAEPLPSPVRGRVEFDDVWFSYPSAADSSLSSLEGNFSDALDVQPGAPVLRGVSFVAEPGETVALVGPSGAGKTTICNLVARLYDVTSGAVRIDGRDVRDVALDSLSTTIGVVTQDPHFFHDTIRVNLRYGRADATDREIEAACRDANIHDLVASLPERYDTIVGERGYRMSGGEKQRLAIARVLLKDPSIVILDEATAHLDSESEVAVQSALATALAGRTSLVIAHRLSTIVGADLILVVDEGRVVQRGTHSELVRAEGLYADLYRTQFAETV